MLAVAKAMPAFFILTIVKILSKSIATFQNEVGINNELNKK